MQYQKMGSDLTDIFTNMLHDTRVNGGATAVFRGKETARYVVGDGRNGYTVTPSKYGRATDLRTYIDAQTAVDDWKRMGFDGFGFWIDPETELLHVDPITFVPYFADAMALGSRRGEKSIYDTVTGQCPNVSEWVAGSVNTVKQPEPEPTVKDPLATVTPIIRGIEAFHRDCAEREYTDTDTATMLLVDIRDRLADTFGVDRGSLEPEEEPEEKTFRVYVETCLHVTAKDESEANDKALRFAHTPSDFDNDPSIELNHIHTDECEEILPEL